MVQEASPNNQVFQLKNQVDILLLSLKHHCKVLHKLVIRFEALGPHSTERHFRLQKPAYSLEDVPVLQKLPKPEVPEQANQEQVDHEREPHHLVQTLIQDVEPAQTRRHLELLGQFLQVPEHDAFVQKLEALPVHQLGHFVDLLGHGGRTASNVLSEQVADLACLGLLLRKDNLVNCELVEHRQQVALVQGFLESFLENEVQAVHFQTESPGLDRVTVLAELLDEGREGFKTSSLGKDSLESGEVGVPGVADSLEFDVDQVLVSEVLLEDVQIGVHVC